MQTGHLHNKGCTLLKTIRKETVALLSFLQTSTMPFSIFLSAKKVI